MLTEDQARTPIEGLNVYDAVIMTQMIEKLLQRGLVSGKELPHVASIRLKLNMAVKIAVAADLDNLADQEEE